MIQITELERREIIKRFPRSRFNRTRHKYYIIEDRNSFPFNYLRMLRGQISKKQFERFRHDKMDMLNQSRGNGAHYY